MQYLFLFTISPVQSFISQARKAQDLYAGSQMLSDMCRVAIAAFKAKDGNLIFPNESQTQSLPNRYLGKIDIATAEDAKRIGRAIEEEVRKEWYNQAKEKIRGAIEEQFNFPHGFDEQINNHLEIYWAFQPLDNDKDYKTAYNEIERTIASIKNARPIQQYSYQKEVTGELGERGKKCMLDGERNIKFYRPDYNDDGKTNKYYKRLFLEEESVKEVCILGNTEKGLLPKILQAKEGLSAVSFYKRCYLSNNKSNDSFDNDSVLFPSTARIALMDTINRLFAQDFIGVHCAFLNKLHRVEHKHRKHKGYDEQMYYAENLTNEYFEKNNLNFKDKELKGLQQAHKDLVDVAKEAKIDFPKYYAIVAFDGDNMGKWRSGEYLTDTSSEALHCFHQEFAQCLKNFSDWAMNDAMKISDDELKTCDAPKIKTLAGKTIYSGGDDFLAFVNLNHLVNIYRKLVETFDELVSQKLKECVYNGKRLIKQTDKITFSASVIITHYKTPLNKALTYSRELLDNTKAKFQTCNKQGIGLKFMTKNMVLAETFWQEKDDPMALLESIVQAMKSNALSSKFYFQFEQAIKLFKDTDSKYLGEQNEALPHVLRLTLKHFMKRASLNDTTWETIIYPRIYEKIALKLKLKTLSNVCSLFKLAEKIAFNNF